MFSCQQCCSDALFSEERYISVNVYGNSGGNECSLGSVDRGLFRRSLLRSAIFQRLTALRNNGNPDNGFPNRNLFLHVFAECTCFFTKVNSAHRTVLNCVSLCLFACGVRNEWSLLFSFNDEDIIVSNKINIRASM